MGDVLIKDIDCPTQINIDGSSCLIIDVQAAVVALGKPKGITTFGELASKFLDHVLSAG